MRVCTVEDCDRGYLAKGYCVTHYSRMWYGKEILASVRYKAPQKSCKIEGCEHRIVSRGWCSMHYQAWRKHGDPLKKVEYNYYSGAEKARRGRYRRQGAMLWYKMTRACKDCGISDPRVLEFDHVRGEKEFTLKEAKSKPLDVILAEIEKCDVVCANCHRIRTQERINFDDSSSTTFVALNLKGVI